MNQQYPPIKPGKKRLETLYVETILLVLGRAFQSASRHDDIVKKEVDSWEEGFSFMMRILPNGPKMCLEKKDGKLYYRGSKFSDADLVINFKNVTSAFMVFSAQVGTAKAYAQKKFLVKGDLTLGMSLIRCLNMLEGYLFPKIINKKILKRVPDMPVKKHAFRLWLYTLGIVLGI